MRVSARSVGETLARLVGRDLVSEEPKHLADAAIDGQRPRWVVRPTAVDHIAGVLALARDEDLAVIPRGSGSALGLGLPAARLDIMLDLTGLADVPAYNADDLTVTVQAGVTAGALNTMLGAQHRQYLPVDPGGWLTRTVGGIAATGASGPRRVRYGSMRDLLLGVRFVQADGVVTWGGARVVKSVSGYDVPKLLVGSLGTLGVLAELTLRLHPMPDVEQTWLVTFPSADAAQSLVAAVLDSTLQPSRLEFLNEPALRTCSAPAAAAAVAVSIASVEEAVREQGHRLAELAGSAGGRVVTLAEQFWTAYDRAITAEADDVVLSVGSLPSRLADTVREIERAGIALASGVPVIVTGCAALGTLRVRLMRVDPNAVAPFVEGLRRFVGAFGGHVVIQHASALVRTRVDPWGPVPPGVLQLTRALKDEFDSRRVLNPGRFVGGL